MRAFLLTTDPLLVSTFIDVSQQFGIEAQCSGDLRNVSQQLNNTKYEALVLDFDTAAAEAVLEDVRKSRGHHNAVIFGVASNSDVRDRVLHEGVHFLLKRPIQSEEIKRTLDVAYDFMLGERRRYFRCTAELPVRITVGRLASTLECTTLNISSDGMAVNIPVPLALAETLTIALTLPNGFVVNASGIVIWDDRHGKCGLKLQCKGQESRRELDSWLNTRFEKTDLTH